MKTRFFMIAALAAMVGFASCAKDNGEVNGAKGDPVSISIKLDRNAANFVTETRTVDPIDGSYVQNKVSMAGDVYVYIFNNDGKLVHTATETLTSLSAGKNYTNASNNLLTTSANKVVILGNVPAAPTALTPGTSTYANLQSQIHTLSAAETWYSSKIMVYGEGGITYGLPVNGLAQGTSSVALNPLLSRIDVTVSTTGSTGNLLTAAPAVGTAGTWIKGVAILYSGNGSHYAPAFPYTFADASANSAKALQSGLVAADFTAWAGLGLGNFGDAAQYKTKTADSFLLGLWDGTWNSNANVASKIFTRSFYAFPPTAVADANGYSASTIVTAFGTKYDTDGNASDVFWPVHFSSYQTVDNLNGEADKTLSALEQGRHYTLAINLKGDLGSGSGGGPDPETPKSKADVEITITDAKWKPTIVITQDFQ